LHRPVPSNIAIFARDPGFDGLDAFVTAILNEYCYRRATTDATTTA